MIHTFTQNGKNIVIDTNSGAVHLLDDIAYQILDNFPPGKPLDTPENVSPDVREAYDELTGLVQKGRLFSPDYTSKKPHNLRKDAPVKALCLHVAHDCNLRCGYCFAGTGNYRGQRTLMSPDTAKKAIDFVIKSSKSRRNIEIDFFGGEPLFNFETVESTVAYAREQGQIHGKNFRFTLTTNGVLLDDEKLDFLNQNMDNLVLSLDGRPEINDLMRKTPSGEGSYAAILPNLIKAAKTRDALGKSYYLRGTFTRHNLDFSADVYHLADLGFRQISVEPVTTTPDKPYAIREEDLQEILRQYDILASNYDPTAFEFFHFTLDQNGPCAIKRLSGCGAGCDYLAIAPNGNIYPCHQFVGQDEFLMGSLESPEVILNPQIPETFSQIDVTTKSDCRNCWAKFYCSGGCHANAYQTNKNLNQPDKIACALERKRVECSLYIQVMQKLKSIKKIS